MVKLSEYYNQIKIGDLFLYNGNGNVPLIISDYYDELPTFDILCRIKSIIQDGGSNSIKFEILSNHKNCSIVNDLLISYANDFIAKNSFMIFREKNLDILLN